MLNGNFTNKSFKSHKLLVSTPLIIVIVLIILFTIGCDTSRYDKGYKNGYSIGRTDGYQQGINDGYNKGYNEGYDKASSEILKDLQDKNLSKVKTIDSFLLKSSGNIIMFWVFSFIIIIALCAAIFYLIIRIDYPRIRFAKFLVLIISSYIWFRIIQTFFLNCNIPGANSSATIKTIIELIILIISIILCYFFDRFYIESDSEEVWVDIIGIAFCTFFLIQSIHYLINWRLFLSQSAPQYVLHLIGAFSIGGIVYTIYALVKKR